jgi:ABC-type amino acid transport substrate-binding protein
MIDCRACMARTYLARLCFGVAGLAIAYLAFQSSALAAPPAALTQPARQTLIRIAALNNPPYVSVGPDGLQGLSIATFKIMAAQNDWKVDFILEKTQDDLINAIIANKADIGIGGITPTPELGLIVDFSDANQLVPLALLVKKEGRWSKLLHTLESTAGAFVSGEMLALFAFGIVVILVAGYLIRMIERRRNPAMFPEQFRDNAWWAAQTLVAHNCGNKLPLAERGRYIAIMLMLGGTVFTAEITALLTTNLAASINANAPITGIGDVGVRRIATVDDSYAQDWLQQNLMTIRSYKTAEGCVEAVEKGQTFGAVFDEMALLRVLSTGKFKDLKIAGDPFGSHPHAFVLRKRSPYLAAVNQGLSTFLSSKQWELLNAHWVGSSDEDTP